MVLLRSARDLAAWEQELVAPARRTPEAGGGASAGVQLHHLDVD